MLTALLCATAVGVYVAYALVAYCYFGVSFTGYNAYGSTTGSQILYSVRLLAMQPLFL